MNGGIDMKAYEYLKPGHAQLTDKEKPTITSSTDAIIRIVKTTIWYRSSYHKRRYT